MHKPMFKVIFHDDSKDLLVYQFLHLIRCLDSRRNTVFDVYAKQNDQWVKVWRNNIRTVCGCGRDYDNFRFRATFMDTPRGVENCIEWLKLPMLCMICYYKLEIAEGRWAPKQVYETLHLEKP